MFIGPLKPVGDLLIGTTGTVSDSAQVRRWRLRRPAPPSGR